MASMRSSDLIGGAINDNHPTKKASHRMFCAWLDLLLNR